jgi:hypothetical protein
MTINDMLLNAQNCTSICTVEYCDVAKKNIIDSILNMRIPSSNKMEWKTGTTLTVHLCSDNEQIRTGYFTGMSIWQYNMPFILDKKTEFLYIFQPSFSIGFIPIYENTKLEHHYLRDSIYFVPMRKNPFDLRYHLANFGFTISVYDKCFDIQAALSIKNIPEKLTKSYLFFSYCDYYTNNGEFNFSDILYFSNITQDTHFEKLLTAIQDSITLKKQSIGKNKNPYESSFMKYKLCEEESEYIKIIK